MLPRENGHDELAPDDAGYSTEHHNIKARIYVFKMGNSEDLQRLFAI